MESQVEYILITGGAGFIGSNYLNQFAGAGEVHYVNLDKLTYAGSLSNIHIPQEAPYTFVEGDICDGPLLKELFETYAFTKVLHFAAESHVDNSISGPEIFIDTNIRGTFNLLEVARRLWLEQPHKLKREYQQARFLHVSTDEVYGSLGPTGLFTEKTAYAPNSPYSASKASSDMLVRSYFHTYGLPVVTTNCSNNYGPNQHDEKLIPTIIRKALEREPIPIYGDGTNVRDWLYVADHCQGINLVLERGRVGQTYNIGGRNERQNIYIARRICQILDQLEPRSDGNPYSSQIRFVQDRFGHDRRYAIDASKIEGELGWKAVEDFESGIEKTVRWYLQKYNKL